MNIMEFVNSLKDPVDQVEEEVTAALALADVAAKKEERFRMSHATTLPAPPDEEMVATVETLIPVVNMGILAEMPAVQYKHRGFAYTLITQGVCERCCHCGMKLVDGLSVQYGIGPICRKSGGFTDEPVNGDEMQAMIDLAEFPQLVDLLVANFKPKGNRAMMNAMVRIASMNRRSPVHQAISDAVESLGWAKLASKLRESLSVVEIKEQDSQTYNVWIKKSEYKYIWSRDIRTHIPTAYLSRQYKGLIVPKSDKKTLWALILKHYEGLVAVVPDGQGGKKAVKIEAKKMTPPASQPQIS